MGIARSNAPSEIRDPIGRALIIIFLTKPFIDLLWNLNVSLGPIRLSPTTVAGLLVLVYFLWCRLKYSHYAPPFARIFEAFLVLGLADVLYGYTSNPPMIRVVTSIDWYTRMLGSYLIFFSAYGAARRYEYKNTKPFLKAIVIGTAIAMLINLAAIKLGYGGIKAGTEYSGGPQREVGLYYDAGTLGNMAFFNLVFTAFHYHTVTSKKALWLLAYIASVLVDLYLIAVSGSRAPVVTLAIAALGYMWYLRGWARVFGPIVAGLVLLAAATLFLNESSPVLERLEGDLVVLEGPQDSDIGRTDNGAISLGKYESLGSNRGLLWAVALTQLSHKSMAVILFGEYFTWIKAHSDYIDVLARNGVVGLGLYVFLIYGLSFKTLALARSASRQDRLIKVLACVLLVCYAANAFPFRPLLWTTTSWYMWTIVALALAAIPRTSRRPTPVVAASAGNTPGATSSGALPRPGPIGGRGGYAPRIRHR